MSDAERLLDMVSEMRLFKKAGNLGTPGKLRFYLERRIAAVASD